MSVCVVVALGDGEGFKDDGEGVVVVFVFFCFDFAKVATLHPEARSRNLPSIHIGELYWYQRVTYAGMYLLLPTGIYIGSKSNKNGF